MAVVANLTGTPIPAGDTLGGAPMLLFHQTVTAAGGAGTYTLNHGLTYKPTLCLVIAQLAEGTAPTAANAVAAHCVADDSATLLAFNLPGNGTFEIIYG